MMHAPVRRPPAPRILVDAAEVPGSCVDCHRPVVEGDLVYSCEGELRCHPCGRRHADAPRSMEVDHV